VTADVGNQRQEAGSLDCRRELSLVSGAHAAQPRGKNLSLIGDEATKRSVILVIDPANAAFAEWTAFLWSSH
jgi:hypothetical protein